MPLVPVLMPMESEFTGVNPYVPTAAALASAMAGIVAVILLAPTVTVTVAVILVGVMTTMASVSSPMVAATLWTTAAAMVTVASAGAVAWVVVSAAAEDPRGEMDPMEPAFPEDSGLPYMWTTIPFSDDLPDSADYQRVVSTPQMTESRQLFDLIG